MAARRFSMALIALAMVSCSIKKSDPSEVRVHLPKVQFRLDPHKMEDAYSMLIVSQLYRGLLRFDPTGNIAPSLAESWSESKDHLRYRFKLRKSTFSNGETITASHVQQSFARLFYVGAAMSADIDAIKGIEEFAKSHDISRLGIKIVSDSEVEFQLSRPSALFLKQIAVADCAVLDLKSFKDRLIETASGTFSGPYRIAQVTADGFKLEKWRSDDFDSASPPSSILFFTTDKNPIQLAREKRTDTLDRDPVTTVEAAQLKETGWGMVPTELTGETFVVLNPKFIPEDARAYLFGTVNSEAIVDTLGMPQFKPAHGLIPAGFQGELSASDSADLRKQKPLYKRKISFLLDFDPSSEWEQKTANYLKRTWSHERIEVNLNPLSKGEKLQRMFEKKSQAVLGHKGIDYPDGFSVLTYFKGKYEANYFHVDDPKVDMALSKVLQDFDSGSRSAKYRDIQKLILAHHTVVPLFFGSQASGLWSDRIRRAPSHPMGYHTMAFESIEMRSR